MTCKHCGKEISPDDKICPHCHEDLVKNAGRRSSSTAAKIVVGCAFAIAGVFVIGIFAAVAIPKFANTKEKAYVASMRADLRQIATVQEAYFVDNRTYTTDGTRFHISGSNHLVIPSASKTGWTAVMSNPNTAITCQIGFGSDSTPAGDGVIQCH